jgi:hypothetical protein
VQNVGASSTKGIFFRVKLINILLTGTDVLRVSEIQQYERHGNCFTITSEPVVEGAAGELFSTNGNIVLEPSKPGTGCLVTMNIILHCKATVWGIQSMVEAFMEMKAIKSFDRWMEVASQFCREQPALAGTSLMPSRMVEEAFSSDDSFYDLEEAAEVDSNRTSIIETEIAGPVELVEVLEMGVTGRADCDTWLPQAVVQHLSDLRSSNEASRAHMQILAADLQKLQTNFGILSSQLQEVQLQQQYLQQQAVWGLVGLAVTTALLFGIGHAYMRSQR